jgi:vancomycin resistance protein VanJ
MRRLLFPPLTVLLRAVAARPHGAGFVQPLLNRTKRDVSMAAARGATAFFFCTVALAGCATPTPPEPVVGAHFSVLTYNVNFGGPGSDSAVQAIADADADVVCLQETNAAWEKALREGVGPRYPHAFFHDAPAAGGAALLSKWPVRSVEFCRADAGWFPACIATVETPAGPVQFVSVHLRPPVSDRGSFVSGYFTTPPVRLAEVGELLATADTIDALPTPLVRVIVGDFNEGDGGPSVRLLRERGYRDALQRFDPYASTWHWQLGPMPLRGRLDHVLYSRSLNCLDARVIRRGASDHFPVVAVFGRAP